ncbi:YggS family pyridoxal phosphate-dependent enzyme [Compostibacter hankyongensis]|uniref:Pyridoxal phosphate homeostasis protein n=1 Tax=Compostibacter hankyongensis TaxID=1007089 RepID=A0ABP8G2R6_9BACT
MSVNIPAYRELCTVAAAYGAKLAAVSKTKPASDILALYEAGQRIFAENYVQELTAKYAALPRDIRWHSIGHLQTNKVKYIAPFVSVIQGVDSLRLLHAINREAGKNGRRIDCLLQIHIATETTKFGLDEQELDQVAETVTAAPEDFRHIRLTGLMGMASFTPDQQQVAAEFGKLKTLFGKVRDRYGMDPEVFCELSMGMSADYRLALEAGSTLIRVGSLLFGERNRP